MIKKESMIDIIKIILEIAVLVLLSLTIIYLIKSDNGLLASREKSTAKEKIQEAIQKFWVSDGMTIEEALRQIEGLENIDANVEQGEYKIIVDGQQFFVTRKELIPEDEENNAINAKEVTERGEEH